MTNISESNIASANSKPDPDSRWYKDAIIYELHVRAFYDSSADGVGDFAGLTRKLDYLQDLGVTALWLLPFYVSPLQDDGYDIADYTAVHPAYGTLNDFKVFLNEAHNRGLRVITELVLNHTSDQHPWFQRARHAAPDSPERNFYVWSDSPERFKDARVIFRDFEASNWTWDPVAQAYYWHRFYSHQPDLNFDNPEVRRAMFKVVDFWLKMGVDGLRLDAVPYLYEREATTGENLPETHAFLRELRAYVDSRYSDRMLLAEANQWPEESVAYFGDGDECHMAFHFPLMPRLFMSIRREDRFPIVDIMAQTPEIPDNAQWALFLRNHDELTLEMVTDEERLYMYRVYAHDPDARINLGIRRRLAPLLRNDRRRIELMNALLFSLPGTPVVYYGDEIGMGDNIYLGDRNGVRTPMQWSADRNAGFSRANPQQLYLPLIVDHEYHHESVHVEAQQANPHSLLAWTRRIIALRKRHRAFGRGSLEFLHPDNRKVLAFVRAYEDEKILVVANLSRFVQHVELDLSAHDGAHPVELFGRVPFPPVGNRPYFLTLAPHAFYWFALEPQPMRVPGEEREAIPHLTTPDGWETIIRTRARHALEDVLPDFMCGRRWFRGGHYRMLSARVVESVPLRTGADTAHIGIVRVDYGDHDPETYLLPLAFATGERAEKVISEHPDGVIARLTQTTNRRTQEGVLYDATCDPGFARALLALITRRNTAQGGYGAIVGRAGPAPVNPQAALRTAAQVRLVEGDLNNTSIAFGEALILKLFRCVDEGTNPDVEIGGFLTERRFEHTPPLAGSVEYKREQGPSMILGILEQYVRHDGHAWDAAQQGLMDYLERTQAQTTPPEVDLSTQTLLDLAGKDLQQLDGNLIGPFMQLAGLLGKRTAELHLTLASGTDNPQFRPQPFTPYYQRSLYQALRRLTGETMYTLRARMDDLPETLQAHAHRVLDSEKEILEHARRIYNLRIDAARTRCHCDYHLSQVLYANGDFVFIDFEGEPGRLMSERQLARSPFKDVASMIGSFYYAAHAAPAPQDQDKVQAINSRDMEPWLRYWVQQTAAAFLGEYLRTAGDASFVPRTQDQLLVLLDTLLLEHMLDELGDNLRNRPERVNLALQSLIEAVGPVLQQV